MKILTFLVILQVLFVHEAYSDKATEAYRSKDYKLAYQLWEQAAKRGDVVALYNLGVMEINLKGKSVDVKFSAPFFEKSCDKNFALACLELGLLHEKKMVVAGNSSKSFQYILKAAKKGDPSAQYKLAGIYEKTDIEKAIVWYKKSAKKNFLASANNLGLIYQNKRDWDRAIYWYKKAVNQNFDSLIRSRKADFLKDGKTLNHLRAMGYHVNTSIDEALSEAQFNLGYFYETINSKYRNKKLARVWYRKAALQDQATAQHNLGAMYALGVGGEKDLSKAKYWFKKAAKKNYPNSIYNLAHMHLMGMGMKKDPVKAIKLYRQVHGEYEALSYKSIGRIYDDGMGVPKNQKKALYWYIKAAKKNNLFAQLRTAEIYFNSERLVKSFHWFNTAAKRGNSYAQYIVGRMYYVGSGVKRSKVQAMKWLKKAEKNGSKKASKMLKDI